MPLHPSVADIVLRLALTIAAGALIGANRGERGHAAGLRTTMLVCLAASVAMIQTNLLLPVEGKTAGSFSVMDVMRLPLGILSGIGFIGGGAILRKGDTISGVTTAATLWLITVIGLCFGGGQIGIGIAATGLAWIILYALKRFDARIARERRALFTIQMSADAAIEPELDRMLCAAGVRSHFLSARYDQKRESRQVSYELCWRAPQGEREPRELVQSLLGLPGVQRISWRGTE